MPKARFITLEGGEGTGKSTQIKLLSEWLISLGHAVITTREPGGSLGAEQIRKLLVEGDVARWDGITESLLHFAARRDHLVKTVFPALEKGCWVICDRFADSTYAYQGVGHGIDKTILDSLYEAAVGTFQPDLTLVLDLPVKEGLKRAGARGEGEDRYERMGLPFHESLRQAFLAIAVENPDRCEVVDASGSIDEIHQAIRQAVAKRLDFKG